MTAPIDDLEALGRAVGKVLGADRRLRSREHHNPQAGLSSTHMRALGVLMRQTEATIGTLAKEAGLNPASATAMVDQLEVRGLAERRRDTRDRRLCLISLTDAGRLVVEEKTRQWRVEMSETFADIPQADILAATRVLDQLFAAMERLEVEHESAHASVRPVQEPQPVS
jgi:DNA-binding MarR family transcriptional regulator